MPIRVCPKCVRAFYLLSEKNISPCPHCGYVPHSKSRKSGQQMLIKRSSRRRETDIDLAFSFDGVQNAAKMTDYSESGARIVYHGDPVPVNSHITLDISASEIEIPKDANVVWTRKLSMTINTTGLKFKI